jgi:hypothetical protein
MTQATNTINGKTSQMACRHNLRAFRPKQICDEIETFVLLQTITHHTWLTARITSIITLFSTNILVITYFLQILLIYNFVI